jgi:hypothetical protein
MENSQPSVRNIHLQTPTYSGLSQYALSTSDHNSSIILHVTRANNFSLSQEIWDSCPGPSHLVVLLCFSEKLDFSLLLQMTENDHQYMFKTIKISQYESSYGKSPV